MRYNKKQLKQVISAMTIKIPRGDWELYKQLVPRGITLNESVVELIRKYIGENTRDLKKRDLSRK